MNAHHVKRESRSILNLGTPTRRLKKNRLRLQVPVHLTARMRNRWL
jgi:hypothetical protein